MSKLSSFKRHLNPQKVWLANQVAEEKIKIARQVVLDRAKKDAAFAADVLKAVGDALPKEIKEACEESVKQKDITERLMEETKGLVAKWDKTGLLDGIKNDVDKSNMSVLIESESKQIIVDAVNRLGDGMVVVQADGGGELIVPETDLPDYPRDGDEPPLDITEKLVQEKGPEAEKA